MILLIFHGEYKSCIAIQLAQSRMGQRNMNMHKVLICSESTVASKLDVFFCVFSTALFTTTNTTKLSLTSNVATGNVFHSPFVGVFGRLSYTLQSRVFYT